MRKAGIAMLVLGLIMLTGCKKGSVNSNIVASTSNETQIESVKEPETINIEAETANIESENTNAESEITIKPMFDVLGNVWGKSAYDWNFEDYVQEYSLNYYESWGVGEGHHWRDTEWGYSREASDLSEYSNYEVLVNITSDVNHEYVLIEHDENNLSDIKSVAYELWLDGWYGPNEQYIFNPGCTMESLLIDNKIMDLGDTINYLGLPDDYRSNPQNITINTDMGPAIVSFEESDRINETESGILGILTVKLDKDEPGNTIEFRQTHFDHGLCLEVAVK